MFWLKSKSVYWALVPLEVCLETHSPKGEQLLLPLYVKWVMGVYECIVIVVEPDFLFSFFGLEISLLVFISHTYTCKQAYTLR